MTNTITKKKIVINKELDSREVRRILNGMFVSVDNQNFIPFLNGLEQFDSLLAQVKREAVEEVKQFIKFDDGEFFIDEEGLYKYLKLSTLEKGEK